MKKELIIIGTLIIALIVGIVVWNASYVQAFGFEGTCVCSIDPYTGEEICCKCSSDGSACSGQGTACGGGSVFMAATWSDIKTTWG